MENNVNNVENMNIVENNVVSNIVSENQIVQEQTTTSTAVSNENSNISNILGEINPNIYLAIAGGSVVLLVILIIILLSKKKNKKIDINIDQKELDALNNNLSELKTQVNPLTNVNENNQNSVVPTNSVSLQSPIEQVVNPNLSNLEINSQNSVDIIQNNDNSNVVNESSVVLQSNLEKDITSSGNNIDNINSEGFNNIEISQINELANNNIDLINNQNNNLNNENNTFAVSNDDIRINNLQENVSQSISDNVVLNNNIDSINNQDNNISSVNDDVRKNNDMQERVSESISSFNNNEINNDSSKQSVGFGDLSSNIIKNNELKLNDNNLKSTSDKLFDSNNSVELSNNNVKKTICSNCGEPYVEGDMFCVNCGNKLN